MGGGVGGVVGAAVGAVRPSFAVWEGDGLSSRVASLALSAGGSLSCSYLFPEEFRVMQAHLLSGLSRPVMDVEVRLEPTLRAPGEARRFVARALDELGYPELAENARI